MILYEIYLSKNAGRKDKLSIKEQLINNLEPSYPIHQEYYNLPTIFSLKLKSFYIKAYDGNNRHSLREH